MIIIKNVVNIVDYSNVLLIKCSVLKNIECNFIYTAALYTGPTYGAKKNNEKLMKSFQPK